MPTDPAILELAEFAARHVLQGYASGEITEADLRDSPAVELLIRLARDLTEHGEPVPEAVARVMTRATTTGP